MRILSTLLRWWWALRRRKQYPLREAFDKPIDYAKTPWANPEHDIVGDFRQAVRDLGPDDREWKTFPDGQRGYDISDLDQSDVEALRKVYGPAGIIPDAKLVQWAEEAKQGRYTEDLRRERLREIDDRLAEIAAEPLPEPVDDGYRPVSGPDAGTSPKTGIVYPPKVTEPTTTEWANLILERAYGKSAAAMPAGVGYSMRYLNQLKIKAERRSASAYELSILRSRGLV